MKVVLGLADDPAIGESLRAVVSAPDFLLMEGNIEEGIQRLIASRPDVVVLDDGPSLGFPALQAIQEASDTPVVMLSSRSDNETLAAYVLAGAATCLVKPFECDALKNALDEVATSNRETTTPAVTVHEVSVPEVSLSKHQHHAALRWLGRTPDFIVEPSRLSQSLVDALTDIFDTQRVVVILRREGVGRIASERGIASHLATSLQLSFASGLLRLLEETACLVDRRSCDHQPDAARELQLLGGRLAVPIIGNGRTCGALIVGDKTAGRDYGYEERELLSVMARNVGTCLEKAKDYRDTSRQKTRLDAVLSNISTGVVTVRPDRTISMINESAERILQLSAIDVLGKSVQKLGSGFADVVMRTLEQSKPHLRESIHDRAINATIGLSVTPLGAEGVVALFSRIPDDAQKSEDTMLYSPLWESLSSRLAQEIKNPLVAINTFAQLLPTRYDSEEFRQEFAEIVQKEVARINGVVETLFNFSKHPRLNLRHSELSDAAARVLKTFESTLDDLSIKLETHFKQEDINVALDPELFDSALRSIVQNSIDAMQDSGGVLSVTTERENGTCEIRVADTGPGVDPKNVELIFMPFFSTKEQGMGMGLTLAERILEQHEGDIELVNNPDEGSVFRVHLPTERP